MRVNSIFGLVLFIYTRIGHHLKARSARVVERAICFWADMLLVSFLWSLDSYKNIFGQMVWYMEVPRLSDSVEIDKSRTNMGAPTFGSGWFGREQRSAAPEHRIALWAELS